MEMAVRINKRDTDADIAVRLLRERRTAMHYREIIAAVRELRGQSSDPTPAEVAATLTQINIDARFVHMGKGVWGLRDWNPPAPKPEVEKPRALRSRKADVEDFLLDDEDELEDEDLDEIPEDELDDDDIDDPEDVDATEEVIDEVEDEIIVDEETDLDELEVLDEEEDDEEQP